MNVHVKKRIQSAIDIGGAWYHHDSPRYILISGTEIKAALRDLFPPGAVLPETQFDL